MPPPWSFVFKNFVLKEGRNVLLKLIFLLVSLIAKNENFLHFIIIFLSDLYIV